MEKNWTAQMGFEIAGTGRFHFKDQWLFEGFFFG